MTVLIHVLLLRPAQVNALCLDVTFAPGQGETARRMLLRVG
jgi:hypothetical protein